MIRKLSIVICFILLATSIIIPQQLRIGGKSRLGGQSRGHKPGGSFTVPSSLTWEQVPSTPEFVISIAKTGTKIFAGTRSGLPTTYIGGAYVLESGSWNKINAGLSARISICSDWPSPCSSAPSGGTFTLSYLGQTTSALAFNASNATIQSTLEGLSTIGSGNIILSDGPLGQSLTITFQGARANDDPTNITLDSTGLTGTTPGGMIRGPRLVTQLWATPTGALLANVRNNLATEMFRLPSGGTTWQKVSSAGSAQVFFDYTSDVSGNILSTNLVTTNNISKSVDDGVTFSAFSTVDAACYGDDSRPIAIYRAPTSIAPDNTIFVGPHNDALHYSTDNGATWTCMNAPATSIFGGINSIKVNGSGQPIITGQYGQVNVHTGAWASPNTWNFQYLTANGETTHDLITLSNGDLIIHGKRPYRSTDGGITWSLDDNGIPAGDINNPDGGSGSLAVASHTILIGSDKKLYIAVVNQLSGWGIYRTTVAVAP